MRIKKLVMGLALGVSLLGAGNVASAKASTITVKVDKADNATAKKVDKALKQGKAVTLKVKGNKKSSKKLLIKLQDAVAKANIYGARFDLDNGDEEYAGKGNVFQTYGHLSYKKSGNYGCYTITKSSANAYKYFLKCVDQQYKRVASIKWKQRYNEYVDEQSSDASSLGYEVIVSELDNIAEAYMEQEGLSSSTQRSKRDDAICVIADQIAGKTVTQEDMEIVAEYAKCCIGEGHYGSDLLDVLYARSEVLRDKAENKTQDSLDVMSFQDYVTDEIGREFGKPIADFYLGKTTYLNSKNANNLCIYGAINMKYDFTWDKKGDLLYSTDECRMRELYKGAEGVCADFTAVNRTCLDYMGVRSYGVSNVKEDHAICVVSGSEFDLSGEKIVIFDNERRTIVSKSEYIKYFSPTGKDYGWDKLIREAMGSDYPF